MPEMSNAELIAEIEKLDATATKGPWYIRPMQNAEDWPVLLAENPDDARWKQQNDGEIFIPDPCHVSDLDNCIKNADAAFVSESRTLLPLAAERLRECERKLKAMQDRLYRIQGMGGYQAEAPEELFLTAPNSMGCDAWLWPERANQMDNGEWCPGVKGRIECGEAQQPVRYVRAEQGAPPREMIRMLRLKAEEMAYQQYGHEMARMGDEAAKLRARIAELEAENARMREALKWAYRDIGHWLLLAKSGG